ncbi:MULTISPECIES: response regulator transcription factor [Sphingomonas]|uniref:response regulator transcription factor n=1 Tax=Sphingomonas TaxID=13687 RepID=UPI001E4B2698|nr:MULTISPECIES: response regulator transcription factor [Sphingomonas]
MALVVDDDEDVRTAVGELLLSVGIEAVCFSSTRELVASPLLAQAKCLIVDIRMPGASGLDLQEHLKSAGIATPIVFLTGHGDIPMSVQAMKSGAIDFLTKPVRDQTLIDAVLSGIERDKSQRADARIVEGHLQRFSLLTPRERQVLREVAMGRLNKQIAYDLGISEITVKLHRSNVMRKMSTASVGELIRAWEKLPADVRGEASH